MTTFPSTFPDPNQSPEQWISEYHSQQAQTNQRGFQDYFNDVLRERGLGPATYGPPQYPYQQQHWQSQDQLMRQQASSRLEQQNRSLHGSFFDPHTGVSTQQAQFLQDLFLGYDLPRIQGAADRQFARNQAAIGSFTDSVTAGSTAINETGTRTAAGLRDLAGTIGEPAMGYARGSIASAEEGVRMSSEMGDHAVQAGVAAVEKNLQLALNGNNPDGTPMSMEQRAATMKQVMYDATIATGQIRAQYDQQTLSMKNSLTQAYQGAASTAGTMAQLSAGLQTTAASIENSARLAAAQFQATGMEEAAKLIMANPESIVSVSNGLLNMWGVFLGGTPAQQPQQNALGQILPLFGMVAGGAFGGPGGAALGGAAGGAAAGLFGHGGTA